jgi:hypothetical protein
MQTARIKTKLNVKTSRSGKVQKWISRLVSKLATFESVCIAPNP